MIEYVLQRFGGALQLERIDPARQARDHAQRRGGTRWRAVEESIGGFGSHPATVAAG